MLKFDVALVLMVKCWKTESMKEVYFAEIQDFVYSLNHIHQLNWY